MNDRKPASEYGQRKFQPRDKKLFSLNGLKDTMHKFWHKGYLAQSLLFLPVLFLVLLLNPATIMMIAALPMEEGPEPAIKYAEFPFTLVYEVNGEVYEYSDTIICEYIDYWDQFDIYCKKAESTQIELEGTSDLGKYNGKTISCIYFDVGIADYYMGLSKLDGPQTLGVVKFKVEPGLPDSMPAKKAYKKYGFRFISWECAPPIENSFSE